MQSLANARQMKAARLSEYLATTPAETRAEFYRDEHRQKHRRRYARILEQRCKSFDFD